MDKEPKIEVYDYLEEYPGMNLNLPTICKAPDCERRVYFPYHVMRYSLPEIHRNFFWLFCSDKCKQDWVEFSLARFGSRLCIVRAAAYDIIQQAYELAQLLSPGLEDDE